jgi:hypothetical protein
MERTWSPAARPARAAGPPGVTLNTVAIDFE